MEIFKVFGKSVVPEEARNVRHEDRGDYFPIVGYAALAFGIIVAIMWVVQMLLKLLLFLLPFALIAAVGYLVFLGAREAYRSF